MPHRLLTLAIVALCGALLHLASEAHGAQIKSVQRGSVVFTSAASRMGVTLPQAVDPAKTFVWGGIPLGSGRFSAADPNATRIAFDLESGTTLALERRGMPTNTPTVEWQAVEFLSGVSVPRGVRTLATGDSTVKVTLPTSIDVGKSFVLASIAPNTSAVNIDERWAIRSRLTASNNLELSRIESGTEVDVYW